jgi:hypothetical protein
MADLRCNDCGRPTLSAQGSGNVQLSVLCSNRQCPSRNRGKKPPRYQKYDLNSPPKK